MLFSERICVDCLCTRFILSCASYWWKCVMAYKKWIACLYYNRTSKVIRYSYVYFIQMYENRIIYDILSTTIFLHFQDIFTVALMRDEQRSSMFARIRDSYKWKTGSCRAFDWKEMKQMMQWDTKYVVWFIKRVDSPKRKFKCCFVGQNTTHDI